jgi:heparin/heparan-sulfate lyase
MDYFMKLKLLPKFLLTMAVINLLPHSALADPDPSEKTFPNPYAAPTITPPAGVHPRVFVTAKDIPEIKARLNQGEMVAPRNIMDRITNTAASPIPSDGAVATYDGKILSIIKDCALLYLLNGDVASGNKAATAMVKYMSTVNSPITFNLSDIIYAGALVYDWCYPLMTPEQRLSMRRDMVRLATGMEIGYPPTGQGVIVGHGAEAQLLISILSFGAACYDENPNIYDIAAGRFFQEYVKARAFSYPAGYHHQGDAYGPHRLQADLMVAWLFKRMSNVDVLSPLLGKIPYGFIYLHRPDGRYMVDGDNFTDVATADDGLGKYDCDDLVSQLLASSYYEDPVLRSEFLREYGVGVGNWSLDDVSLVLFDKPEMGPGTSISTLPLTKYFGDPVGFMIARTGWLDTPSGVDDDSNIIVALMRIGGYYFANHAHLEAGSFEIYYKGSLALDSGLYQSKHTDGGDTTYGTPHDLNYHKRSIAHNTLLIYDPSEEFLSFGTKMANDGGQRMPNQWREPGTLDELTNPANGYQVAEVQATAIGPDPVTPDYSYIKGDITKAYSAKVSSVKRSMVFINTKDSAIPGLMFVYDAVSSTNPSFKKTWLLHCQEEPTVAGNVSTIMRTEGQYKGKLVNTTLLPEAKNMVLLKDGGPGREALVDGKNYLALPTPGTLQEQAPWRIELSPATPAQDDEFLNVMQIMDAAGTPTTAVAIDGDKVTGAKVNGRVVLFGKKSEVTADIFSFTVDGTEANIQFLVTDLAPGMWSVTKDGQEMGQYQVKAGEGVLYFKGAAGKYTVKPKAS